MAEPFIKWVGGKRQLIPALMSAIGDSKIENYHEPFLGGGALFFHLASNGLIKGKAYLSDANDKLIATYRAIRDEPTELVGELSFRQREYDSGGENAYYAWRELFNNELAGADDAYIGALFIALNKTGFNGLYRTSKKSGFNTPWGKNPSTTFMSAATWFPARVNLMACSDVLQNAEIFCSGYRTGKSIGSSDFVYMDPPYIPVTATSNFTSYTADGFGDKQQVDLRNYFAELRQNGARAIVSNSSAPRCFELYKDFDIVQVDAKRNINCVGDSRGAVKELIVRNWK